MARSNYKFEKRQKELARKKKKEIKKQKKLEKQNTDAASDASQSKDEKDV